MGFESSGQGDRRVLSKLEQEMVEQVEHLPLNDPAKFDLLLAWRGEKLATDIHLIYARWNKGEASPEISEEEKEEMLVESLMTLQSMGLSVVEDAEAVHDPEEGWLSGDVDKKLYVSSAKENAEKLQKIWQEHDEVKNSRELGRFYGFPPSAIEAYGQYFEQGFHKGFKNREMIIEDSELPPEIQEQDYMAFAQFKLSRGNWRDELETAKRWAAEMQAVDPALYERMVTQYQKERKGE